MEIDSSSRYPRPAALPAERIGPAPIPFPGPRSRLKRGESDGLRQAYWYDTCFYASPIGDPESEERAHADLFLNSLVEPAIEAVDPEMTVVRADELPTTSITASVVEHVREARLVVADLSFHNPNVFYEVGQRDAQGKPFVLISRAADPIPSNLRDSRVIQVNTDEVHAFVSEMGTRQDQISRYADWALTPEGERYFSENRGG
jgi:hypothetical protein